MSVPNRLVRGNMTIVPSTSEITMIVKIIDPKITGSNSHLLQRRADSPNTAHSNGGH